MSPTLTSAARPDQLHECHVLPAGPCASATPVPATLPPLHPRTSAPGDVFPAPFVSSDLESVDDPFNVSFTSALGMKMLFMVPTLPDNGLDSQARVLHAIIQNIRRQGFTSTYWFRDKSLQELRLLLQNDPAFSDATRSLFVEDAYERADAFILILRHICRRPPSYESRKSVRFAPDAKIVGDNSSEAEDASIPDISPPIFPPFVVDDLWDSPDPLEPRLMAQLIIDAYLRIRDIVNSLDPEVQILRVISDLVLKNGLQQHVLSDLDDAGLRDRLRRDTALWGVTWE